MAVRDGAGDVSTLPVVQVRVMDGEPEGSFFYKGDKLYPRTLLGEAELPLARIQVIRGYASPSERAWNPFKTAMFTFDQCFMSVYA